MQNLIDYHYVVAAVVFSLIGLIVFAAAFLLLEVLTPKVAVWKEIVEKQNMALAVLLGALALGIAFIIGSAIHG
jgi:putative membrane protein